MCASMCASVSIIWSRTSLMRWESLPASCSLAAADGEFGARGNQIRNGFGLREIDAAIEKRALGELAGLRQARAARQHRIQNHLRRQHAAVAGESPPRPRA